MRTNEELIALLQTATQEERSSTYGELYIGNKGIIARICYRWAYAKGVEADDLMQEAYFMLVAAADAYAKSETPCKFITYLTKALDWGFIRYFCKQLHLTQEVCCLDSPIEGKDGGENATMLDFIADESQDVEQTVISNIYSEDVARIFFETVKDFPPQLKEILHRIIFMRHSFKSIAEACGKSAERIRQLYMQGIRKLRETDIRERLRESEERDKEGSIAYTCSGFKFWKNTGMSSVEYILIKREEREERQERRNQSREERRAALYGNK